MAGLMDNYVGADTGSYRKSVRIGQLNFLGFDTMAIVLSVDGMLLEGSLKNARELCANRAFGNIETENLEVLCVKRLQGPPE